MNNLLNKTCVVTGATGYLGKQICISLAKAKANVVLLSSSKSKAKTLSKYLSENYNVSSMFFDFNLNKLNETDVTYQKIYRRFKSIDVFINCAYYNSQNSIETSDPKKLITGFNGSLIYSIICSQKIIKYLKKSKGSLINIGSIYGIVSPDSGIYINHPINPLTYSVSKAGIIQYTKYAAANLAKFDVRVNCISPGPFPSDKVKQNKPFIKELKKKIPLKRVGDPKEIGEAVVFLASDSSSYITGHNLVIDGGWTSI